MSRLSLAVVLALTTLTVAGCSSTTSPAEPPTSAEPVVAAPTADLAAATAPQPTSESEPAPSATGMTGEDFIAQAASLSGTKVTLGLCSLQTSPSPDGLLACRVVGADGSDLKDPTDLPVDIFVKQTELAPDMASWLSDNCPDEFCTVQISGLLNVSPETFYLEMSDVAFAEPSN